MAVIVKREVLDRLLSENQCRVIINPPEFVPEALKGGVSEKVYLKTLFDQHPQWVHTPDGKVYWNLPVAYIPGGSYKYVYKEKEYLLAMDPEFQNLRNKVIRRNIEQEFFEDTHDYYYVVALAGQNEIVTFTIDRHPLTMEGLVLINWKELTLLEYFLTIVQ